MNVIVNTELKFFSFSLSIFDSISAYKLSHTTQMFKKFEDAKLSPFL